VYGEPARTELLSEEFSMELPIVLCDICGMYVIVDYVHVQVNIVQV